VDNDSAYRRLLARSLIALAVCAVLVTLCYFFVDRPVAFFVHDHDFSHWYPVLRRPVLEWPTLPPPILETWAPAVMAALAVRRAFGPFRRWELALLAACVSLLVAAQFKDTLKFAFGRYWPDTWIRHNPSLIGDGAYGFHPFHKESFDEEGWYGSFPSGHTTRAVAIAAVYWVAYPRWPWRLLCVAATAAVVVGLIGMNYHFVGDTVAGAFVGGLVGVYAAHGAGLGARPTGRTAY
jgi:membrane-associated phospholipid phosphatase